MRRDEGTTAMGNKKQGYFKRAIPVIDKDKCNNCGMCAKLCGGQPLLFADGKVVIDANPALGCIGCGQCMAICPTGAITVTGRGLSSDAILELPPKGTHPTAEQLESLLVSRRSIRNFKPVEVERNVVDRVLQIASTAPMGIPPSEVGIVVFHGRDRVKAFSDDMQTAITRMMKLFNPATLLLFRAFMSKADIESFKEFVVPIKRVMEEEKSKGGDPLLYGAPVALLFHRSPYCEPADCYIAATYAMIAAESMGLGTCMIGMVAPFLVRDKKLMRKYGIPKGNEPTIVLLMGYPGVSFRKGLRRDFSSVKYNGEKPMADV